MIATAVVITFVFLALLHVYWAITGAASAGAALPARADGTLVFRPGRLATLAVAIALAFAAAIVSGRSGLLAWGPAGAYRIGAWLVATVLLLRTIGDFHYVGIFKQIRGTRFADLDNRLYTPLCGVLAIGVGYLATR